ncbi:hypothetical protein PInf_005462 [Phytophthora infestans]|nr:hypothetical protein PInf_005462 [Phytophthora infestans]
MSELKDFSRKDNDEDCAREWVGKVKSAFLHDQAPDDEKCLFCGLGASIARPYYHARKRADETPLAYLHRLSVAEMREKLRIKHGPLDVRNEHVEHFIKTLDDRDLADQLALLRIADADSLEDVLRARQPAKNRLGKAHFGSSKYRQKIITSNAVKSTPARNVQAMKAADCGSDSNLSGSESDGDLRRIYIAAAEGEDPTQRSSRQETDRVDRATPSETLAPRDPDPGERQPHGRGTFQRCTHCGSHRRDDLLCWKRLTCQRCDHPSDRCLFVFRKCGEIHDWYNPAKHGGVLPESAEKMLN